MQDLQSTDEEINEQALSYDPFKCVCVFVCMCERERESEREGEKKEVIKREGGKSITCIMY